LGPFAFEQSENAGSKLLKTTIATQKHDNHKTKRKYGKYWQE